MSFNSSTISAIKIKSHWFRRLRTFALVVSVHPYCARKFTCHAMHRARALSTKEQMAIAKALIGFNDLGRSVTPTFLFRNRFTLQLSTHCPIMNKNLMWTVRKISRFLSTEHGILPSSAARRVKLWSPNANLFFEELHQLTKFA